MVDNQPKSLTRRDFLKAFPLILAACGPTGQILQDAEATLAASERKLTSGMVHPPAIKPGDGFDPNIVIQNMERSYAARGFFPGELGGQTAEWWNTYGSLARELIYLLDRQTARPSQYYDFS